MDEVQTLVSLTRNELEHQISQSIQKDNSSSCHFLYQEIPVDDLTPIPISWISLIVITRNPKHNEKFMLYKTKRYTTHTQCLDEVISYLTIIKNHPDTIYNYKVVWAKGSYNEIDKQTSYFYAKNLIELVDKFFEHKNPNEFIIYSITMNPTE